MKNDNSDRLGRVRQYNKSELPRLRWTPELHRFFVHAVEILGGRNKATPKRILQMMGVKELKISHIKSHLQMYRSSKLAKRSQRCSDDDEEEERIRTSHGDSDNNLLRADLISSISSSNGRSLGNDLKEEVFNTRTEKHTIISQQHDSESCLVSKMSDEECIDGLVLEEEACQLSLSLKPSSTHTLDDTKLWAHQSTSQLNFVNFLHPHVNLDLTI